MIYSLNKTWNKLNMRSCIINTKATTCIDEIEGWCLLDLFLYYPTKPSNRPSTFKKNLPTKFLLN